MFAAGCFWFWWVAFWVVLVAAGCEKGVCFDNPCQLVCGGAPLSLPATWIESCGRLNGQIVAAFWDMNLR